MSQPPSEKAPIHNPPFEIVSCTMENMRHDTGDDIILWWVKLKTPTYQLELSVWFDRLQNYCREAHPETYAYFSSIRKGIIGLGPKHGRVMDVLVEEGFDLMPLITEYIQNALDLERYHQHDLKLMETIKNPVQKKKLNEKAESMTDLVRSMRKGTIRMEAFTDQVMEYLGTEVARQFPEIFNSDPEFIEQFHGKLVNWMLTIRNDVDTLSFKASKEGKNG